MNRQQHLLIRAMEECNELAHRISKAILYGESEVQEEPPDQNPERLTNRERIYREYFDLRAVLMMAGYDSWDTSDEAERLEGAKMNRVEKWLNHSRRMGTLD